MRPTPAEPWLHSESIHAGFLRFAKRELRPKLA